MLAFLSKVHKGQALSYQPHCCLLSDWTDSASYLCPNELYLIPSSPFGCATTMKVSARNWDVSGAVKQLLPLVIQCFTVPVAPAPGLVPPSASSTYQGRRLLTWPSSFDDQEPAITSFCTTANLQIQVLIVRRNTQIQPTSGSTLFPTHEWVTWEQHLGCWGRKDEAWK